MLDVAVPAQLAQATTTLPQPKIQWFFQGDEIKNNTQSYIVSTQNGLTIKKIPQTAEGNYTCTATNDEGTTSAIGEIKVVNR